jgi:dihydropteroate synthase
VHRRLETFRRVIERARAQRGAALMGICNVTPDSFSDGGDFLPANAARARVVALVAEGADVVDIGAESTRPGAQPVPAREQLDRMLAIVEYAVQIGACVSVDTTEADVATACLEAGACAINDVSCLRDEALARAVARAEGALILMHTRGTPHEMRGFGEPHDRTYTDVVRDVCAEWQDAACRAERAGVLPEALVMDPGLGFAKTAHQSEELVVRLREVVESIGFPVAVGASRKSFLTLVEPGVKPTERLGASIAAAIHSVRCGASVLRVHDVRATRQAVDFSHRVGST